MENLQILWIGEYFDLCNPHPHRNTLSDMGEELYGCFANNIDLQYYTLWSLNIQLEESSKMGMTKYKLSQKSFDDVIPSGCQHPVGWSQVAA